MDLNIESLKQMGAFTGAPVKKEIEWDKNGETLSATVYVRRLSYHTAISDINSYNAKKDNVAARIASCIVSKEGDPVFTCDDITGDADPERGPLDGNLTMALLKAIGEVNNMGKATGSAS